MSGLKRRIGYLEARQADGPFVVAVAPDQWSQSQQQEVVGEMLDEEGVTNPTLVLTSQRVPRIEEAEIVYIGEAQAFFDYVAENGKRIGPDWGEPT
ncbi:MAG: hypothetical protein AAFQ79_02380 [Pseudomonadota bacterium]